MFDCSIIISSFKSNLAWLSESVTSVLLSITDINYEIILLNDGDDNPEIERLLQRFTNLFPEKISYYKLPHQGCGLTTKEGVNLAKSDLIVIQDSDDIMKPNRLQIQIPFMLEHPEIDLTSGGIECLKENKIVYTRFNSFAEGEKYTGENYINNPAACIRRSTLLKVGNYRKTIPADMDMYIRLFKYGIKFHWFPTVFTTYRLHENQNSRHIYQRTRDLIRKELLI